MESFLHKNLQVFHFQSLRDWLNWLEKNCDKYSSGIWVKISKKGSGKTSTSYEDIREGCLIYGWIDSLPNKLDEKFYLLKVTPRRKKSIWSKINTNLVEQYTKEGKMKPQGLKEVNEAKKDGRWDKAYSSSKKLS